MSPRVLIAGVGNLLRRDDGFGVVVARRLADADNLPSGVEVIETGIGGLSIVQQLMGGYDALILVDAVDQEAEPGRVFLLDPIVPDPQAMAPDAWREQFSNLHLAEPSRVLLLARALKVLPPRVVIVGCQPMDCEEVGEGLTPPVEAAVEVAVSAIRELVESLVGSAV